MSGDSDHIMHKEVCRQVVRTLIKKYEWGLLSEDNLVTAIQHLSAETDAKLLEKRTTTHYMTTLYEACRQNTDLPLREKAYAELFVILNRLAEAKNWPELKDEAVQRALQLIYEKIEQCRNPAAFLSFTAYKLWQGYTDAQRERDKNPDIALANELPDPINLEVKMYEEEGIRFLLTAINGLSNQRQKEAILLKFFQGLSDKEIAERLKITSNYVRRLRHDGITKLRQNKHLRDYFTNNEDETIHF